MNVLLLNKCQMYDFEKTKVELIFILLSKLKTLIVLLQGRE